MASPWSRYLDWSRTRSGTSARQGGHHVAQKSRITTFPLSEEEATLFPLRSGRENAGASDPIAPRPAGAELPPSCFAQDATRTAARNTVATERAARTPRVRLPGPGRPGLEDRIVFIELVVGDPCAVIVPLDVLVLDEFLEDVLSQGILHQARLFGELDRLDQAARQALDSVLLPLRGVHLVDVLLEGRAE